MKINPFQSVQNNPYRKQIERPSHTNESNFKKDNIQISKAALELQQGEKIDATRAEKVQKLKEQVEAGTYKVDAKAVANKLYEFWNE